MNRIFLLMTLTVLLGTTTFAQTQLQFLGKKTYTENLSDIWGYAAGGKEYALVGVYDGFSIVDVTNPAQPTEVHFISGVGTIWRDIKIWGNYAYVVNEGGGGLLIVDLSNLSGTPTHTWWDGGSLNFTTAHNIFIDENGYAYLMGIPYDDGFYVLDLNTSPTNPTHTGTFSQTYVHDGFVRGDTMWAAAVYQGIFVVVDVTDKSNPSTILATNPSPTNFCHNTWMSDDNNYLFTTDELSDGWVGSFDVSDLSNIQLLDKFRSNSGSGVIPHNAFVLGDYVLISYYNDGVVVIDATHPSNLVEVANYDTSPISGDGFDGCWGVYPYLPSGNILATDVFEGLFIIGNNYSQAAYLEGTVRDSNTTFPLNAAGIEIVQTPATATSAITGFYSTGVATTGQYSVEIRKAGYAAKTISNVTLTTGVTTTVDVDLVPLVPFQLTGKVVDAANGQGIANAKVKLENQDFNFDLQCDAQGNFTIPTFYQGNYDLYGGSWGFVTKKQSTNVSSTSGTLTIALDRGYYDDYLMDFGWTVSGDAPRGIWERGEPDGTTYQGTAANPDDDATGDFGDQAYVTGNGGGSAGDDDVDDGETTLTSPVMNLSNLGDPHIHYSRWFANGGNFGPPADDSLLVQITNGSATEVVEVITATNTTMSQWNQTSFRVSDIITPSNQMRLILTASDRDATGHICEAAIDVFYVTDAAAGPNSAPLANDDVSSTGWDLAVWIDVQDNDSDPDGDPLSTSIVSQPSVGSVAVNTDGSVTYTPQMNYSGQVTFTYEVCDNGLPALCDQATVTITVTEPTGIADPVAGSLILSATPNPFKETVNIRLDGDYTTTVDLLIYNSTGELQAEVKVAPGLRHISWGANQAAGVYLVVVSDGITTSSPLRVVKSE